MAQHFEAIDPHERNDGEHRTFDPMKTSASGSAVQAAFYLGVSVVAMIAALTIAFWFHTLPALFLIWLSGTTFTLGILEYRRSQQPHGMWHGPEV